MVDRDPMSGMHEVSERSFRLIADFTHDWELWEGPDGRLLYVSPSCLRITGYEASAFLHDPNLLLRSIHPDDRALFEEHRQQERAGTDARTVDFRIVTRDGQVRWIGHACQRVYGDGGEWLGWRGSNRDITAQKQAELALQRQTEELSQIGAGTQFYIWLPVRPRT